MRVGIIGTGHLAERRRQAVQACSGAAWVDMFEAKPGQASALDGFLGRVDVVFITVPTADHYRVAEAAAKRGVHVFLEWPPATSTRECEAILRLTEEAGVEAGLSRPLRFHPVFAVLPELWHPSLVLVRQEVGREDAAVWQRHLADMVDLCCALAGSSSVQRIDAEAARSGPAWPDAVAFGVRFHSGIYAQGHIRRTETPTAGELYVAGPGLQLTSDLAGAAVYQCRTGRENAGGEAAFVKVAEKAPSPLQAETAAFLRVLADGRSVPVSVLDGLHTMRLMERLMGKLR